jgi:hypothetical protein
MSLKFLESNKSVNKTWCVTAEQSKMHAEQSKMHAEQSKMHAAYQYDRDSNSACDIPGWLQTGAVMNTALWLSNVCSRQIIIK